MKTMKGKYGQANLMLDSSQLDESCKKQIQTFLDHPAFTNPVAIMADTHAGAGAVIGFTMPLTLQVIPNVIGVDIGCGMVSRNLGADLKISHDKVDSFVREHVPFGFNVHDTPQISLEHLVPWGPLNNRAALFAKDFNKKFQTEITPPTYSPEWFEGKCHQIGVSLNRVLCAVGTLGGGNHFIEIGRSTKTSEVWLTIHTGSRNLGKKVAEYWQKRAVRFHTERDFRKEISKLKETFSGADLGREVNALKQSRSENLPPKNLEWLSEEDMPGYLFDMLFAQAYAERNRELIESILLEALEVEVEGERVESVHNFIDFRDFIIRKGAIRSYQGEKMIVPLNMRDGVLLCEGRSVNEWNYSAPHGAGRAMSRSEARRRLRLEDFKRQMGGIYSTSVVESTLDEAPQAYKESSLIEEALYSTAKVLDKIMPLHNLKATMG